MSCEVKFYPTDSVPENLISQIKEDKLKAPNSVKFVYSEQLTYINDKINGSYFVALFCNNIYIGGVALFFDTGFETNYNALHNIIDVPSPGFQGIAKSSEGLNHPEIKLNSYLIPAIINFLKEEGYDKVHVDPIGKQGKILEEHYGFEKVIEEYWQGYIKYF